MKIWNIYPTNFHPKKVLSAVQACKDATLNKTMSFQDTMITDFQALSSSWKVWFLIPKRSKIMYEYSYLPNKNNEEIPDPDPSFCQFRHWKKLKGPWGRDTCLSGDPSDSNYSMYFGPSEVRAT